MRRNREQDRRVTRGAVIGALLVLASLLGAAQASAATYHAYLCRIPYGPSLGKPAPTDGATSVGSGSTNSGTASQTCATGGAMSAIVTGTENHAVGDGASVLFQAQAGTTIASFRLWRSETLGPASGGAGPVTSATYAATPLEPVCSSVAGCSGRGDTASPLSASNEVAVANLSLSNVTQIRWNAVCAGPAGGTCAAVPGGSPLAAYRVYAADILLDDPSVPAVSNLGGSLLAGGTRAGVQSVTFNATDVGSGVHTGALLVDGTPAAARILDANGGACANLGVAPDARPSYVGRQPCPGAVNGVLTLNTDLLTPGGHTVTTVVRDAAGNETVAATSAITVAGSLPIGSPNGVRASRNARLSARFGTRGGRTRRLGLKTQPLITGRLVNAARKPISRASIEILVRERRSGARTVPVATARTGADGRFRLVLPSGPSRNITLRYKAFVGDRRAAETVLLRALVRAR